MLSIPSAIELSESLILQAAQLKSLIEAFCIESEKVSAPSKLYSLQDDALSSCCVSCTCQDVMYVKAVKNYLTRESTLLSFVKGDIIKLTNKDMPLDQG